MARPPTNVDLKFRDLEWQATGWRSARSSIASQKLAIGNSDIKSRARGEFRCRKSAIGNRKSEIGN